MKQSVINQTANISGGAAMTSGLVGWFAEFYPLISLTISFSTFLVFAIFKWLHYKLERKREHLDQAD